MVTVGTRRMPGNSIMGILYIGNVVAVDSDVLQKKITWTEYGFLNKFRDD